MSTELRPLRIAMWSGPRNISTALMRSWENRGDTFVCDEPLYAHYLLRTDADHPGKAEVIAHHETDWRKIVDWLTGPVPEGRRIFYQKQMSHHLLPEISRDWLTQLTNCFLIREPQEMLTSLLKITPNPDVMDTGLPQQLEIFDLVEQQTGQAPPVIDSRDVLEDPRGVLSALCERTGVDFTERMLQWPSGRRETDGVWAEHWYGQVEQSTGFLEYRPKRETVPAGLRDVLRQCQAHYERLAAHSIRG